MPCARLQPPQEGGGESSPITAVERMEGGFNKAFLMKKANRKEIIAKIPCRNAGLPVLTTESEVAILEYGMLLFVGLSSNSRGILIVRQHTSVAVPRVLSWNSDSLNPVGAEYIIIEKAAGGSTIPIMEQDDRA